MNFFIDVFILMNNPLDDLNEDETTQVLLRYVMTAEPLVIMLWSMEPPVIMLWPSRFIFGVEEQ